MRSEMIDDNNALFDKADNYSVGFAKTVCQLSRSFIEDDRVEEIDAKIHEIEDQLFGSIDEFEDNFIELTYMLMKIFIETAISYEYARNVMEMRIDLGDLAETE